MPSIEVRGVPIAVEEAGDRDGLPVVWAHGLTSSRRQEDAAGLFAWQRIPATRVVRYDAPGHGESGGLPEDARYRWDSLAGDLLAVMDHAGLDRAVVGGASMGCATSLHAALAAPERIRGLLLVIPPTAWDTRAAQAGTYLAGADLAEAAGPGALAAVVREMPPPALFADLADQVRDASAAAIEDMDAALLPHVFRGAAASDLPPPEVLATITVPTTILAWAGDPGHPESTAEVLAGAIPDATLHVARDLAGVLGWVDLAAAFLDRLR